MPACPKCGVEIEENSQFCRHCGERLWGACHDEEVDPPGGGESRHPHSPPPPPYPLTFLTPPAPVYPEPVVKRTKLLGWVWCVYTAMLFMAVTIGLVLSIVGSTILHKAEDEEIISWFEEFTSRAEMPENQREQAEQMIKQLKENPQHIKELLFLSLFFFLGSSFVYLSLRLYASYMLIKMNPWGFRLIFLFAIAAIFLDIMGMLLPFGFLIGAPTLLLIRFDGPRLGASSG